MVRRQLSTNVSNLNVQVMFDMRALWLTIALMIYVVVSQRGQHCAEFSVELVALTWVRASAQRNAH